MVKMHKIQSHSLRYTVHTNHFTVTRKIMAMPHPLLRRAQVEGAPLIDGKTATFVWRGRQAPSLVGDFNCWDPSTALKLRRVAPGLWAAALDLPRNAYMEYIYLSGKEHTLDPLNPRLTPNGLGQKNNFFYMSEGAPSPLLEPPRGPRGTVTRHFMLSLGPDLRGEFVGRRREVHFYRPPAAGP